MDKLGKLNSVELRSAWNHEALDFTNWLAKEENLNLLSEEIGLDIKLIQTEANVGNFNVDILAQEENTGRKIIIENQLEPTNHDHLGKLITYSSGHDAEISIWIVKDVRDEHKQAINWLNDHSDEDANFFLIKMELWKIGDSLPAPKFQIISKPNDWAKAIKKSTSLGREPTETKLSQLEFWNKFKEYSQNNQTKLRLRKTYPQHWYDLSLGVSGTHISLSINTQQKIIGCDIWITDDKELFNKLFEKKEEIEEKLQLKLEWLKLPTKKASRIRLTKEGHLNKEDEWENYFEWLKNTAEKFQEVFGNYIRQIKVS